MWSVENEDCGKCGVWKMRSVENEECGKMRCGKFSISIFHSHAEKQCGRTTGMLTNVNKKKKRDASLHF